jgi:hypothetical protein
MITTEQLDRITEIMHNLPVEEISKAIAELSPEALSVLKKECQAMAARLQRIAEQI